MNPFLFFENPANILRNFIQTRKTPVYVQYYVTAKCNLKCQQCNIIYSNPGHREMDLARIDKAAENLRRIGTAIVLLTGGEPFARQDLSEIVRIFTRRRIHVRIQTNGFAGAGRLRQCVEAGARDISISLDSLRPENQDFINGGKKDSWEAAIEAVAHVTQVFPKRYSFASFGCVITPFNIPDILEVLEFAARISWYVSLVPVHVMKPPGHPGREERLFAQQYRPDLLFTPEQKEAVRKLLGKLRDRQRRGDPLYDSSVYSEDIMNFIEEKPLRWRLKNQGVCDAPALYFAVRPNGDLAPCCEYNVADPMPLDHPEFPRWYRDPKNLAKYLDVARNCSGCMYGSYPEITTAIRFASVALERARIFLRTAKPKNWPWTVDGLKAVIREIREKKGAGHGV